MIADVKTIIEIITAMLTSAGIAVMVYFAVKKGKPEVSNIEQESREHEANAAEKALATTERATQQLYATMKDLDTERTRRRELQKTVEDLKDQLESQRNEFEQKLANQKAEYEKIKSDLEYTVAKQTHKIEMLVLQIQHLGNTPIENK